MQRVHFLLSCCVRLEYLHNIQYIYSWLWSSRQIFTYTVQTEILIPSTMVVSLHRTTSSHIPADCNTDTDRGENLKSRCMFYLFIYLFIYLSFNNAAKAQDVVRLDRMTDE